MCCPTALNLVELCKCRIWEKTRICQSEFVSCYELMCHAITESSVFVVSTFCSSAKCHNSILAWHSLYYCLSFVFLSILIEYHACNTLFCE